ncbi:MAG: aromatic amino acid ammonia-lyase [Pseudomonadota bacterium]
MAHRAALAPSSDPFHLTLDHANALAEGAQQLAVSADVRATCQAAHGRLRKAIAERRHIYGITTGFGPLANRLVDPADGVTLQQNLVHHLATGLGAPFDWVTARAIVLSRLSSILRGYSGASEASIDALIRLINSPLAPAMPSRGTVGASGDLTPLAHMVLAFQGREDFLDQEGARISGPDGLAMLGLAPLDLRDRDGLALVNGTSAMTGIAVRNVKAAALLCDWMVHLTGALAEVMGARSEAWAPLFGQVRGHPGQIAATAVLAKAVEGSERLQDVPLAARRLPEGGFGTEDMIGQDAYTLRCAPQVIGGVMDAVRWHREVVERELNAVTDNPLFPIDMTVAALHGGNFMGQQIALASDTLATAVTVLAGLAERQIARLTDERLNGDLPAFLHCGPGGMNSGFMGAQVTATATLAEMRSQGPVSTQSLSTNGANQDVVSMGTIAARKAADICHFASEVASILALCVSQGIDLRRAKGQGGFSRQALAIHADVRAVSAPLTEDRPLSPDIQAFAAHMRIAGPS